MASDVIIFADFQGTAGDDIIKGTEGDDTIDGLAGNDFLKGLGGDDVIHGGDGNDTIYGGDGDDILYGDGGYNEIRGGEGNDHIISGKSGDAIYGGTGDNTIDSGAQSSVYTIAGGIDHIKVARSWYVDYTSSAEAVQIDNNGLRFSNGTSANNVGSFQFLLGSGDDSFTTTGVMRNGSRADAGFGSDSFEMINTTERFLPMTLLRGSDGLATLSLYSSNGHNIDNVYKSFENINIFSHEYSTFFTIDGSLLYQGVKVDLDVVARYSISFLNYIGQVTAVSDSGVLMINGSTIKGSSTYTITLNNQDGFVTAGGSLRGGAGNDTLTGLSGNDSISGNDGSDTIDGGDGNDYLGGGNGGDAISGGFGDDRISGGIGNNTIYGGDGDDNIDTGDNDDTIDGDAGNDTIIAGAGHNIVDGGQGDDTITGGDNDDELSGSAGVDQLSGGLGYNRLNGGDGNDVLIAARDAIDVVDGGIGNDRWSGYGEALTAVTATWDGGLHVSNGIDVTNVETVSFYVGAKDDYVNVSAASVGTLTIYGNGGVDTIDYSAIKGGGITLSLSSTNVQDTGAGGLQTIVGFENVIGSAKADTLTGTDSANLLTGGRGADTLTGGTGADQFIVTGLADLGKSANIDKIDRITDFSHTEGDKIDLRAIDADPNAGGDQAFKFVGTEAFDVGGGGAGEIRYSQSVDGFLLVQGDINHDGQADFSFLVHNTALVASDLLL